MSNDVQISAGNKMPQGYEPPPPLPPVAVAPPPRPLRRELRGTAWLGLGVMMVFFGVGGGWATIQPLGGAVIASGSVSPEGSRRTVQHLEGGIISNLLIQEGAAVKKGDLLLTLEDVGARSDFQAGISRLIGLAAREARIKGERAGAETVKFDDPILADKSSDAVREGIEQQLSQFKTRREAETSRIAHLGQRIAQQTEQIAGFNHQLQAVRKQKVLIQEEIVTVKEMVDKGLERKPRLLQLMRTEAEMTGTEGSLIANIARTRETSAEVQLEIVSYKSQRIETLDTELTEVKNQRKELEERIKSSADRMTRTTIIAPVSGAVLNLKFKTLGGVIKPGEAILDIVPAQEELIIDARILANDIDDVHLGQTAYVIFPSLPQRSLKRIAAKVITVAADSVEDQKSGIRYYPARVRVDVANLKELAPEIELIPGMPAETFISTGERTLLEYLLQPAVQTIERTMRER